MRTRGFRCFVPVALVVITALLAFACAEAPVTGRKQLILIPESQEVALGLQAFREILKKEKISKDPELNARLKRVGWRIARVAGRPDYKWEFVVIENDDVLNAFALPGGKVAVYSGLLRALPDDAALAAVIGHEVAHAVARHGAERMSHMLLAQLGQAGLNMAVSSKSPAAVRAINLAYGVGVGVGVLLPFSRKEELEADYIGMIYMAKAGYDPTEAIRLWERMAEMREGGAPPEFLSTHPADATRINKLKEHLPQALVYYRKAVGR
jgi:predicted Zn-dependent protease